MFIKKTTPPNCTVSHILGLIQFTRLIKPFTLRGFTLIELVVASTLLVTVSVMGFAAYRQYSDSQRLQNAALDLSLFLQKAKSRAQTQVKPANITNCQSNPLNGYLVKLCNVSLSTCSGDGRYEMHILCGDVENLLESSNLGRNVTFDYSSSPFFKFQVLNGSASEGLIILKGDNALKTIRVNNQGVITIQ